MYTTPIAAPKQPSPTCDTEVVGLRVLWPPRHKPIDFREHLNGTDCITIGRVRQRDVRIRDDSVSKLHCIIERVRQGDHQAFRIVDCDSKNGVLVSSLGHYGTFREVDAETLRLGMMIQLGDVLLSPMNAMGECLVIVARHSEYVREICACYGSPRAAKKFTGLARRVISHVLKRLSRSQRGRRRSQALADEPERRSRPGSKALNPPVAPVARRESAR